MNQSVLLMAIIRMAFGIISFTGGYLIYRYNDLQQAVRIHSIIGGIGPFVLLLGSAIGIAGLATQVDVKKIVLVVAGVTLLLLGTR